MRDRFMTELVQNTKEKDNIVLIIGDLGFSVIEPFADLFPDRFFNAGIAEQNMMSMAAGLASEGMHVFTYSIGNFPTWRCAEQIKNDVDYHNLPVTNVTVGSGVVYGTLGYSHHAVQDLAIMRSLPNMLLLTPSDPNEVSYCMNYIFDHPSPAYLRLGKSGEDILHKTTHKVSPGIPLEIIHRNSGRAIIAIGHMMKYAKDLILTKKYSNFALFSLPIWSMLSKKRFASFFSSYDEILIMEDHFIDGGLASWALESFAKYSKRIPKINIISIKPETSQIVGSESALLSKSF